MAHTVRQACAREENAFQSPVKYFGIIFALGRKKKLLANLYDKVHDEGRMQTLLALLLLVVSLYVAEAQLETSKDKVTVNGDTSARNSSSVTHLRLIPPSPATRLPPKTRQDRYSLRNWINFKIYVLRDRRIWPCLWNVGAPLQHRKNKIKLKNFGF